VCGYVNYWAIRKYVQKVICHGGAGTIQAFLCSDAIIEILPQAYDQFENAKWLENNRSNYDSNFDVNKEYRRFQTEVMKLFGVSSKLYDLDVQELSIPTMVMQDQKFDISIVREYTSEVLSVRDVITVKDCVLISANMIYEQDDLQRNKFKEAYAQFCEAKGDTIATYVDICFIIYVAGVSMKLYLKNNNVVLVMKSKYDLPESAMQVDDENMHANVVTLGQLKRVNNELISNIQQVWPNSSLEEMHITLKSFMHAFNGTTQDDIKLDKRVIDTINACKRKTPGSHWQTLMRKSNAMLHIKTSSTYGVCMSADKRLVPWCIYGLLTQFGYVLAVCISVSGVDEVALYHGQNEQLEAVLAIKLHQITGMQRTNKVRPLITADIVAINQQTKKRCEKSKIPVVAVGLIGAKICYVHSTWNRKHHKEKERECIATALDIKLVDKQITPMEKIHLKKLRLPRCAAMSGDIIYCIEPLSDGKDRVTNRLLRRMSDMHKSITANVYYTTDSDKIPALKTLFKLIDDDSFERHCYVGITDDVPEPVTTLAKILEKYKRSIGLNDLETNEYEDVCEAMGVENFNSNNVTVELVDEDIQHTVQDWLSAMNDCYMVKYPYVLIHNNGIMYRIVSVGSGNTKDDEVTPLDIDGQDAKNYEMKYNNKTESKFDIRRVDDETTNTYDFKNTTALNMLSGNVIKLNSEWNDLLAETAPELSTTSRILTMSLTNGGDYTNINNVID